MLGKNVPVSFRGREVWEGREEGCEEEEKEGGRDVWWRKIERAERMCSE